MTGWRNTKPKPGGSGLPEELSSCDCSMLCWALILRKDLEAGVPPDKPAWKIKLATVSSPGAILWEVELGWP